MKWPPLSAEEREHLRKLQKPSMSKGVLSREQIRQYLSRRIPDAWAADVLIRPGLTQEQRNRTLYYIIKVWDLAHQTSESAYLDLYAKHRSPLVSENSKRQHEAARARQLYRKIADAISNKNLSVHQRAKLVSKQLAKEGKQISVRTIERALGK